ncbi:MAG: ECF-type sigma factor [Acidobacteriota bacterium]
MDLLVLDEALDLLAERAPQRARMVELRFFAGLNKEEIASVLNISPATVSRWWKLSRVWLYSFVVEGQRLEL